MNSFHAYRATYIRKKLFEKQRQFIYERSFSQTVYQATRLASIHLRECTLILFFNL